MNTIEAMKQALEALETLNDEKAEKLRAETIPMLYAAIEQMENAEPVAEVLDMKYDQVRFFGNPIEGRPCGYLKKGMKLYTHPAPAIPAGWKLVPVEPNINMKHAADKVDLGDGEVGRIILSWEEYGRLYAAMISAAPQPPKEAT